MSTESNKMQALDELLKAVLDGDVDANQRNQLATLLQGDHDLQLRYIQFISLHSNLEDLLGPAVLAGAVDMLGSPTEPGDTMYTASSDQVLTEKKPRSVLGDRTNKITHSQNRTVAWWTLSACVLAMAGGATYIANLRAPDKKHTVVADRPQSEDITKAQTTEEAKAPKTEHIAKVARIAEGYQFQLSGESKLTLGDEIPPGSYRLEAGTVGIAFSHGSELVIESPAEFEFIDDMNFRLERGKIRMHVVEAAHGFRVLTPEFDIEDLGTEFGVSVGDEEITRADVYSGRVRLHRHGVEPEEVTAGYSTGWKEERWQGLEVPSLREYASSADIGQLRWQQHKREVLQDPSLAFYYDFEIDPEVPRVIKNLAGNDQLDATQIGGVSVNGRWPGKSAIMFENTGDSVELDMPGTFDEFTVLTWLKLDSLKLPYQGILTSHLWEPGMCHLQIRRTGSVRLGIKVSSLKAPPLDHKLYTADESVPIGSWMHVATVVNLKTGEIATYMNGDRIAIDYLRIPETEKKASFGKASIGNWYGFSERDRLERPLCGRIDEIAFYERALTPEEIKNYYSAGNGF